MGTDSKILTVFRVGPSRGFQLSRDIDAMLVKRAGLQTLGNAHQQTQQAKGDFTMGLSPLTGFGLVFRSRLSQHHSPADTHLVPGPQIAHGHTVCPP